MFTLKSFRAPGTKSFHTLGIKRLLYVEGSNNVFYGLLDPNGWETITILPEKKITQKQET